MKETSGKVFFIIFLVFILSGCKKEYAISEKQDILFQFEYLNHAWGYQHNGFIIDNEGNIMTYSNPDNWNFPDEDLSISALLAAENLSKCRKLGKKIPIDELQKYSRYINNIASSKVTALKSVAADAGSYDYICYKFSENTNTYKGYLIKREGDFTCENLNFYAKRVVSWMKAIDEGINDF
jgi:hypothetical protein